MATVGSAIVCDRLRLYGNSSLLRSSDRPFNVLVNVYNSLIQPHFDYCNVVWGNCNKGLSEKLQRLQNRAARILMSASYDSNLDDLLRALGWRRLYYQRLEQKSILMYKTLHGMTPDYLRSRFVYRDNEVLIVYGIPKN